MTRTFNFLLLGVAIGILIAPRKGSETRKKLSKSVNNLSDYVHDMMDSGREEAEDYVDAGIDEAEHMGSKVSEVFD